MIVAIINNEERELLQGVLISPFTYFNLDMLNVNNQYCIDSNSIEVCDISWLKEKPLILYIPKPQTNPFE